jgi:hypothetical protein
MVGIALGFASIPAILDRRLEVLKQALPLMSSRMMSSRMMSSGTMSSRTT